MNSTNQKSALSRLLNQKEVSKIIRKSEAWLERKRWEGGGIPYRKIGRNCLYSECDVLAWLNNHPKISSTSEVVKGADYYEA